MDRMADSTEPAGNRARATDAGGVIAAAPAARAGGIERMKKTSAAAAALQALADPTRRQLFEHLRAGPRAVGELARTTPVSRPAVSQHLAVLKAAGLVRDKASGTRRVYEIDPKGLGEIRAWIDDMWEGALRAFAADVESDADDETSDSRSAQNPMTVIRPAPVRKSIVVKASAEKSFTTFTSRIGRWWPRSKSIGSAPQADVVLEPGVGGRWYERGTDGSECQWGKVLQWEPPGRLVLAWQIGADWKFDPTLVTEVEVTFTALGRRRDARGHRAPLSRASRRERPPAARGFRFRGRVERGAQGVRGAGGGGLRATAATVLGVRPCGARHCCWNGAWGSTRDRVLGRVLLGGLSDGG